LNTERTQTFLEHFVSYRSRLYSSQNGKESALWLLSEIENHIAASGYKGVAHVEAYEHSQWIQPSIIAKIEGSDPTLKEEVVILGAHLDSINSFVVPPAPGADDNGSGSSVLLESFRALIDAGFVPKRSIEFQWYAAEEVGLRGSGEIAQAYKAQGVKVVGMINFDVVGYYTVDEIGIITDRTDSTLSAFVRKVVEAYLTFKWVDTTCGYGCSDHASYTLNGFPAAFPVAIKISPHIHTARDTLDTVNYRQVMEFSKLAVGYAVELSQPAQE